MRATLLALLSLSAVVTAIPPPAPFIQQPFTSASDTVSRRPSWRTLSAHILEAIWRPHSGPSLTALPTQSKQDSPVLPPNLAQYGGDVVIRFNFSAPEEAESLSEAAAELLLDVWGASRHWVDIRLAKDLVPSLLGLLPQSLQRSHQPLLVERELARAIYETYPSSQHHHQPSKSAVPPSHVRDHEFSPSIGSTNDETNIFFSDYQPLSVINPWMRLLASLFTTHVRLINIGTSYEGRDIPALRVGVYPRNAEDPKPKKRKTVLIIGGLHAREWIGTSTVNFIAYNLITSFGKDQHITRLLEEFDFVFVPTLNPDGYVYTWEKDRLWRKSRQRTGVRFCPGIDLDRGFGYKWDGTNNACSEAFAGEQPFDAVEAKALADWAKNEVDNKDVKFVGFLDLHSYAQEILYPYSYTCQQAAPGEENLEELALGLEKSIRLVSGQIYESMPACESNIATAKTAPEFVRLTQIENSGGSALDWFYHNIRVQFAYQIKLRDRGTYGFLLPKENIIPTGQEILEAVLYFADFLSTSTPAQTGILSNVELIRPEFGQGTELDHPQAENDDNQALDDPTLLDHPQFDLRRLR